VVVAVGRRSFTSIEVQISATVRAGVAGFVFHAPPRAQIRGQFQPTRVLPRGDDLVPAKEKARNVAPPFPPGPGYDVMLVVLHGS